MLSGFNIKQEAGDDKLKYHNRYYSMDDILKQYPKPVWYKRGKNTTKSWCRKVIRKIGKEKRRITEMNRERLRRGMTVLKAEVPVKKRWFSG